MIRKKESKYPLQKNVHNTGCTITSIEVQNRIKELEMALKYSLEGISKIPAPEIIRMINTNKIVLEVLLAHGR